MHQNQPYIQSNIPQSISEFPQQAEIQEIISISSDSEKEIKSEPNKSDKELWKFRNPMTNSKYILDVMDDVEDKDNERWLSKRYTVHLSLRKMPTLLNLSETV